VEVLFLKVVTIVAFQVAEGAVGFDKNLKFTGGFGQGSLPGREIERRLPDVTTPSYPIRPSYPA
ncbi:MAG: hypothetical protein H6Q53_1594, partial [Deltaproteobacteria bacterium]|nr:hypothetical protein [Deltaproteobacteria bacterium]